MVQLETIVNNLLSEIEISNEIENRLNDLLNKLEWPNIFNDKTSEVFIRGLIDLLELQYLRQIFDIEEKDFRIGIFLQVIKWAIRQWSIAIEEKDSKKTLFTYTIIGTFDLPESLLKCYDKENINLIDLDKILSSFQYRITVPKHARYTDKEFVKDYEDGIREDNLEKVFSFIDAFERSNLINLLDSFSRSLIKLAYKLKLSGINQLMSRGEPITVFVVLYVVGYKKILSILLDSNGDSIFPLLKGLIQVSKQSDNFIANDKSEMSNDDIEGASKILAKIYQKEFFKNSIIEIMKIGNLRWNKNFHKICGAYLALNKNHVQDYLKSIDFSFEKGMYGEDFFNGLLMFSGEQDLHSYAKKITHLFQKRLREGETYYINMGTGYYKFIILYMEKNYDTPGKYIVAINKAMKVFNNKINSWFLNNIIYYYTILYYLITFNAIVKYDLSSYSDDLKPIKTFLQDNRHLPDWGKVEVQFLLDCIFHPIKINKIPFVLDFDANYTVSINK